MSNKKFKHGLILGKFLPLHNGHIHLMFKGITDCENLTVLVCSLDREPIPGTLRRNWVKKLANNYRYNKINVVHINYDLPQEPSEHPNFWEIWCNLIKKHCPEIQVIFTSEDYGFEIASRMNIKHVIVDKERIEVPISGTAIRENPLKNWEYISDEAKPYFLNRIYLLGPESTCKTVMSQKLAKHFETNWVPEYGRALWEKNNGSLHYMDFYEIAVTQRSIEEKMASMSTIKKVLFCDTEVMTTKVFGELMFPEQGERLNPFFDYHINKQLKESTGHYFIMSPEGIEPFQDGTRNFIGDKERKNHFDLIVLELRRHNVSYTIITGTYEERFEKICNNVSLILNQEQTVNI